VSFQHLSLEAAPSSLEQSAAAVLIASSFLEGKPSNLANTCNAACSSTARQKGLRLSSPKHG